jgi:hypothetical protein
MIRVAGFVHLHPDTPPGALEDLSSAMHAGADELDLLALQVSPTKPVAHRAGQLMVLAAFRDLDSCEAARRHPVLERRVAPLLRQHASHVEVVRYEQGSIVMQDPDLKDGIQRTLLLHVDPTADPAEVAAFEAALAAMPRYIDTIRNSSLSPVQDVWGATGPRWTHVWEQEFRTLEGLTGPYMNHAYHWAYVDTWFDPQSPNHIVDTTLVHAMCDLDRSILAVGAGQDSR